MIVIARNPLDVFPSFANLVNLHSHSLQIQGEYHTDYPDFWESWVTQMVENMRQNHFEVVNQIGRQIPTFYMRYEDLKIKP